jgi:hypothetical protein
MAEAQYECVTSSLNPKVGTVHSIDTACTECGCNPALSMCLGAAQLQW